MDETKNRDKQEGETLLSLVGCMEYFAPSSHLQDKMRALALLAAGTKRHFVGLKHVHLTQVLCLLQLPVGSPSQARSAALASVKAVFAGFLRVRAEPR